MITIYTLSYNEEKLIPYFVGFYRKRFPNCKIILYDNESTDSTVEIAKYLNCEVRNNYTNGKLDDISYIKIKNNCWKDSETDWVIVCDIDEFFDITEDDLSNEYNIIRANSYTVVNKYNSIDLNFGWAYFHKNLEFKSICFNKSQISEMLYDMGAHDCNPVPKFGFSIKYSDRIFDGYHVKPFNIVDIIKRYRSFSERLADSNIKNKWGFHYSFPEWKIRFIFWRFRFFSKKIKSIF